MGLLAAFALGLPAIGSSQDTAIQAVYPEAETEPRSAAAAWVAGDGPYYFSSGSISAAANPDVGPGHPSRYPDSLEEQARSTMFQLSYNLAQVGLTPQDVAFLRAFITTDEEGALATEGFWNAYATFFGTLDTPRKPPVSLVPLPALAHPGLNVEIEWVAVGDIGEELNPSGQVDPVRTNPMVTTLGRPDSIIASGKALKPQTPLYFASGNIPAPANPGAPIGEWRIEGDAYQQSKSALQRIEEDLRGRGLSLADVIFLRCYLVHDPEFPFGSGSPFAQWNRAYLERFGTGGNPSRPARSTVMVSPFDLRGLAVEIEVLAAYPDAAGPFTGERSPASSNYNLASFGPEDFPIAAAKAVDRRAPLLWSGTLLPQTASDSLTEQATDTLQQAATLLESQGLSLADIVFLHVYGVPDATAGKVDRSAWDSAYARFFGTESQPEKPARSFLSVPAFEDPNHLIAIDFVAAGRN